MKPKISIQIYNHLNPKTLAPIRKAYQEYSDCLHHRLAKYQEELQNLTKKQELEPSWVQDSQSLAYLTMSYLEFDNSYLGFISNQMLGNPSQLIQLIHPSLHLETSVYEKSSLSTSITKTLWLAIVEEIMVIKIKDTPLINWHLEAEFLTIFLTGQNYLEKEYGTSPINH